MGGDDLFVLLTLAAIGSASGRSRLRPAPKKLNFIVVCGLRITRLALFDLFSVLLASESCRVHRVHLLIFCGHRI
jgi:hypothetical protein